MPWQGGCEIHCSNVMVDFWSVAIVIIINVTISIMISNGRCCKSIYWSLIFHRPWNNLLTHSLIKRNQAFAMVQWPFCPWQRQFTLRTNFQIAYTFFTFPSRLSAVWPVQQGSLWPLGNHMLYMLLHFHCVTIYMTDTTRSANVTLDSRTNSYICLYMREGYS